MTTRTIYVPRLIESAEQAEALPVGTVALSDDWMARKVQGGGWSMIWPPGAHTTMRFVIGWTALVPIEAEEETHSIQTRGQTTPEWRTRYITPWEEA